MADVEFDPGALEAEVIRQLGEVLTGRDGLAQQAIDRSHARLRDYADQYDVEPIIDSLVVPRDGLAFDPEAGEIDLRWEWRHPAAEFFDRGTSEHTIQGQPILSFIWEDAPPAVEAMFPHSFPRVFFGEVTVEGIAETRFARHGSEWLQRELANRFS